MPSSIRTPFSSRSTQLAVVAAVLLCVAIAWILVSRTHRADPVSPIAPSVPAATAIELTSPAEDSAALVRVPAEDDVPASVGEAADLALRIIHGRVLDLDRRPVANLQIARFDREEPFDVHSAADGTFELALSDFGSGLEARGPGWATVWADRHDPASHAGVVTILVTRAGRLAGVVLDRDGRVVADARVTLKAADELLRELSDVLALSPSEFEYSVRSDKKGRFDLGEVPLVRGSILAKHGDMLPAAIEVPQQAREDLEIRLEGSIGVEVVVRGRVLTAEGSPADGAIVALADVLARSQQDGTFELRVLTGALVGDRQFELVAVLSGALPARISIGTRVDLENASGRSFELVLGGAPLAISGRVVDSDGQPVSDASVAIRGEEQLGRFPGDDGMRVDLSVTSSVEAILRGEDNRDPFRRFARFPWDDPPKDGSFRIDGLQDRAYDLHVESNGRMARIDVRRVPAGTRNLRIELDTRAPTQRVHGHVVDGAGQPIAEVRVSITISLAERERFTVPETRTDADGAFTFEGLRGKIAEITARLDERESIVEPRPDDVLDDLTITLGRMCAFQLDTSANPAFATNFEVHDARSSRKRIHQSRSTVGKDGGGAGAAPAFDARSTQASPTSSRSWKGI